MKKFDIPERYQSSLIGKVKEKRKLEDPRKKDLSPTILHFGNVEFIIARHFGFCYGVENAIEKSYKAIEENPGRKIYLLSQMIHNPDVNSDLQDMGVRFIQDTEGNQLLPWDKVNREDIVIIPAFGMTLETQRILEDIGVETQQYNTTCPFVEKVWNRSAKLGESGFSIIIHGKYRHEETKATFSHSRQNAPSIIIRDLGEAKKVGAFIQDKMSRGEFLDFFEGRYSAGFDPHIHLNRIGVVNQTTMLASETQEIADYLRNCMLNKYGSDQLREHFADTRDTLCYATNDNQSATIALLKEEADIAVVVGGYNSSNTSHLVELLEEKFRTFFIKNKNEIRSEKDIRSFDIHNGKIIQHKDFLPDKELVRIIITSGASCPDTEVDAVIQKILKLRKAPVPIEEVKF